jgi:hypothetical protein
LQALRYPANLRLTFGKSPSGEQHAVDGSRPS